MYLRLRLTLWRWKIGRATWALNPFWARPFDQWKYGPVPIPPDSPAWQFFGRVLGRPRRAKLALLWLRVEIVAYPYLKYAIWIWRPWRSVLARTPLRSIIRSCYETRLR